MSRKTSTWALEHAPVEDATAVLILMALADGAHEDGTHAFISQRKMAHRARCSTRTVQRHLNELEATGILRRGNQDLAVEFPVHRRPIVWELNLNATWETPPDILSGGDDGDGVTKKWPWGDTKPANGVTLVSDKTSTKPRDKTRAIAPIILPTGHQPLPIASLRDAARGDMCEHGVYPSIARCALCERGERAPEQPKAKHAPRCEHGEPVYRHPNCVMVPV